jgi:large subunit ribosomal protein L17
MRHRVKGRKFNRTSEHRRALMRNLATSLIKHKKITTTVEKAKELRKFIEPIITKAKTDSVASKRYVSDDIKDRSVVKELFTEVIAKVGERPGGYTRIVRLGQRKGDGAELAIIELVDFSGIIKPKPAKKEKAESVAPVEKTEEVKEESKKEEKPKAKAKKATAKKPVEKKTTKEKATKEKKAPVKKTSTTRKSG